MIRFTDNDGGQWSFDERDRIGDPSGMGAVFAGAAVDGTVVAIKRVRLPFPNEGDERRRAREVEIVERLIRATRSGSETNHLVLPISYRFLDEDLLIVMPLAQESLSAALKSGAMDTATGANVVQQVTKGLVQLAALTIAHRDLKPANVLRFGTNWKITDFGLSRDLSEVTGTYTLAGWGTAPYIAPELWLNQPANAKSDLYALGVLAFEVFTGKRPFNGPEEHDFRRQHLQESVPSLTGVTPKIARLVLRLLHKSPSERPQDARAVCDVLDTYAQRFKPEQDAVISAAFELEQRRMADQAAKSAAAAHSEWEEDMRRQALADLDEILADAYDELRQALPDVQVDPKARRVKLSGLIIGFETLEPLRLPNHDAAARAVLQGVVRQVPPDGTRQPRKVYAHLVYEPQTDMRLRWTFFWSTPTDTERRPLDWTAVLEILRVAVDAVARES